MNAIIDCFRQLATSAKKMIAAESTVRVLRQYTPPGYRPAPTVERDPIPYWQERGWERERSDYRGNFQTRFGAWHGYAQVSPGGRIDIFIHKPPAALHTHPHWPCFRQRQGGWFFIHPVTNIPDVSAGILAVEKIINEAYEK